jgi:DNA-binding NarL/FixJ family response regulator
MKVLLAESSGTVNKLIVKLISKIEGIEVLEVEVDGQKIAQIISEKKPDVAILGMDSKSGVLTDVIKNIKNLNIGIKNILLTNQCFPEDPKFIKKIDFDFIFNISLEVNELVKVLEKLRNSQFLNKEKKES